MKISLCFALASSTLVVIAACSSSSSTGGGTPAGTDGGGASNDSGSSTGDGGGSTGAAFFCNDDSSHLCTSYSSIPAGSESTICPSPETVVTACPTADLQAKCSYNSGGEDQVIYWYKAGGHSNSSLQSTCDSLSGTFTAS